MKERTKTTQQLFDELVQVHQRGAELDAPGSESKELEAKIRLRTEDLALIGLLNRAVNRGDTLQEILELLAKETRRIFSSGGATTYLLSEDKSHLILRKKQLLPTKLKGQVEKLIGMRIPTEIRIPLKEGSLFFQLLESSKPKLINDPQTIKSYMGEFAGDKITKRLAFSLFGKD